MWHWLLTAISTYLLHPLKGNGYQLWSGAAGEAGWLGCLLVFWRHVNCHAPRCLRIGLHRTRDGQHRLCRKHHPDLPNHKLSLAEIHARHQAEEK